MDQKPTPSIEYQRAEDFSNVYANNVFFESSFWDVRMIFGQTDQQISQSAIVQHTGVTLPWAQVKVLVYFLQSHLAGHEAMNGRIVIPPNVIPPVGSEIPRELFKDNPKIEEVVTALKNNYDAFIAANPEASPIAVEVKTKKPSH